MLSPLLNVFLAVATVGAIDQTYFADSCAAIGCDPAVSVALGTTYLVETVTGAAPTGYPGAKPVGASRDAEGRAVVTYAAVEATSIVVPKQTAGDGGSWYVATATVTAGTLTFATPYLTSGVPTPKCAAPQTVTEPAVTVTSTSFSILPPKTVVETVTSTSVSIVELPAVTSVSTSVVWSTTTAPATTVTSTYCPPAASPDPQPVVKPEETKPVDPTPPVKKCEHREFVPWTDVVLTRDQKTAVMQPETFDVTVPANSVLYVVDSETKMEQYQVSIDGSVVGATGSYTPDKKVYCWSGEDCLSKGFSNGQWPLAAGNHKITVAELAHAGTAERYLQVWYRVEEKCD